MDNTIHTDISFAFFGTPEVASKTLAILKEHGYLPRVIITSPDRKRGRGLIETASPVSDFAHANNIPCLKPERIDEEFMQQFKAYACDIAIVVAYGVILPQSLIDTPPKGTYNIHYSLLPQYRGASPLEQALLHGDEKTGISIQRMVFRLDSGPLISQVPTQIDEHDTKESLRERLIILGGETLVSLMPEIRDGTYTETPQDESQATICKKIKKEDGEINPDNHSRETWNKYRAFSGWPGIFFFKNGKRIKITKASFTNNSFTIERVIPEGKKEIEYTQFLSQ